MAEEEGTNEATTKVQEVAANMQQAAIRRKRISSGKSRAKGATGPEAVSRRYFEAINSRDYPLVQGCILMIALTYIVANILTDLTYRVLDPRIKVE